MDTLCKKNFIFLGRSFREKCDDNLQNSKLHNCPNKQFEILQDSIAFFSDTVQLRNLKFMLNFNPYESSMQKKISCS